MAGKISSRGVSVYIDGSKVINSVRGIQREMRKLINEQANMVAGSEKYIAHTQKIAQLNNILTQHKDYQKEITKEYSNMSGAADDFEKKSNKSFNGIASGLNKLKGAVVGLLASFTVDKVVNEFAKLDDAQANVQKYTGLTRSEIKELNKDFNSLDTRTAHVRLNELAGDAGRLGIQSRDDIMDFVDAANIIDVALGEDLGEGAIKSIGKLAQMFGDADRMGLKQAMLSTGSAINEVAQNSSASEPYLVDFTNRLSGIGNQAGFSISQLIGLGSVLDQNAQQVETSATALSGLISKLYQEPAKFAKIAGLDVKEFSDLLRKDANEALLTLLDTLGKKGGLEQLAPIFKDMNLNGARASSILSVLAGNIEKVRQEQETATAAFNEGQSVINEYEVQNNTFRANLEKQKNVLLGYVTDIGEKLAPMILEGASAGNMLLKVLTSLISILIEYKGAVLTVAAAYVVYNVALKAQIAYQTAYNSIATVTRLITLANAGAKAVETGNTLRAAAAQKLYYSTLEKGGIITKAYVAVTSLLSAAKALFTGNVIAARVAMTQFNAVVSVNPLGAFLAVVAAVAGAIYLLSKRTDEATNKQKILNDINKEVAKSVAAERAELSLLLTVARNENLSKEDRLKAIRRLNEISPEYLGNLTLENINTQAATKSVKEYTEALLQNAKAKAIKGKVEKEYERHAELSLEINKKETELTKNNIPLDPISAALQAGDKTTLQQQRSQQLQAEISELKKQRSEVEKNIDAYSDLFRVNIKVSRSPADLLQDYNKASDKLKELNLEYGKIFQKQDWASQQQKMILQAQIAGQQKVVDGLQKEYELRTKLPEAENNTPPTTPPTTPPGGGGGKSKTTASQQREEMNRQLRELETGHEQAMADIKRKYQKGDIKTEEDFNEKKLEQQDKYDDERKKKLQDLLRSITDPSLRADIEKQIAGIESKALDRQISDMENVRKKLEKERTEAENKRIASELANVDAREKQAEQQLALFRAKGEISDQEYRDRLLDNEKKYLEERLRINGLTEKEIAKIRQQLDSLPAERAIGMAEARASALDKYGLVSLQDQKEQELALIKYYEDQGVLTHEEAIRARAVADQSYLDGLTAKVSAVESHIQNIAGNLSGTMTNYASAEESAVSRKYDQQIAAAANNSAKQKKLEEKKQKELNAIKAKYADKQFAVQVAQTISSTSVAAMEAYKAMAGIPVIGPALGAAAAAAALAYGASRIKVAREQRDAAKEGYYKGGYYIDEGYTGGGDPKQVRGYLPDGSPVHGKEFIANHATTSLFRPLFDVMDEAQRHNTVSSISKRDLAKALNIPTGYYQGGYNGVASPTPAAAKNSWYDEAYERVTDVLERLDEKMDNPFRGYVVYKGDGGIEEAQRIDRKMDKNAKRNTL
ncbi:TP901 family phage tail tape measure protein [Dysgonomonas sp. PH5-45]|uniref:phage tail tape measure protein n=1 Tax=unclassified Dysgonomonas TaxID=2630389 RepID=UPI0024745949|nr:MULTISPECIES: phage tail tape measure protein [unclassified Dysgonomonas]MDH6355487.1 TP901 family phage tail tape measure protein [Dysgonomonas sp. PH5-45]MDH6388383.1 TP901 family phage tail tape measure protein [Dysgonomonas sp. PH5-37]